MYLDHRGAGRIVLAGLLAVGGSVAASAPEREYTIAPTASGDYVIAARFGNFNRDPLSIGFSLAKAAVHESMANFGYSAGEMNALGTSCNGPCTQADYDRRLQEYFRDRALKTAVAPNGSMRIRVDVPAVVQRDRKRLGAVASQFDQLARARAYGSEETIGAMVAFVQTSLPYVNPPKQEGGREILGFHPPLRALEAGSGDCDTKSALLAAIAINFPGIRMVGVQVPSHYLVGIARVPRQGDAFVEYAGEPYVLIEPSGPGWLPPGSIGETTRTKLNTMADVRIEPLF